METATQARLPKTKMSKDSVGIEIATVTLDASQTHLLPNILAELDEQVLDPNFRRHLAQNGFVAGSLGTQLPAGVQLLVLEASYRRDHPTAESQRESPDQQRFVQCRAGKRIGIGLWNSRAIAEAKHHDGELVAPGMFENAVSRFAMRCRQTGPGVAAVELTPEMEHGELKQKYVVDGGSFHMESRRDSEVFEDLKLPFEIRAGETLMVTCNGQTDMLGQDFFLNTDKTKQKILLVRLAQTQVDVSFGDE